MIYKDIAEYEDNDSKLAKFTISQLHSKIDYLQDRISKAIEYIEDYLCSYDYTSGDLKEISNVFIKLLEILKGDSNE